MITITLIDWIEQFKSLFNDRELRYLTAYKAKIWLQLKDQETGQLHLHELEYVSKDAEHLSLQ